MELFNHGWNDEPSDAAEDSDDKNQGDDDAEYPTRNVKLVLYELDDRVE